MFAVIYGMPLLNKNFINKVRLILETTYEYRNDNNFENQSVS